MAGESLPKQERSSIGEEGLKAAQNFPKPEWKSEIPDIRMQLDPSEFKMNPEILAQIMAGMFGEGIVEKITKAPTEEERKYWTYFVMDRIVNYNDEWPAKSLRESIAVRTASGSDALSELRGEQPKSPEEQRKQKGIETSLALIEDIDTLFDQWFAFYKKLAPTGKIFQLAYVELPEYMPPEFFARVYGEMPGLGKEGDKEWKSMSEQVDIGLRAFMYLALQSDPRWKGDLDWFRVGAGFKKLFPNETSEKEWLYRLKLKTLPNEKKEVAYLYKKSYESLTGDDKKILDSIPAFNKFADPNTGGTVKATIEAIQELMREGTHKDTAAMKFQSQVAVNFAEMTFRFFGLAAMYGTRVIETGKDGKITKIGAEDYPWSDFMTNLTRPKDDIVYNQQNSYYEGPFAWANFAPEHIMVDFLRTVQVTDKNLPESKGRTRSAMELFVEGKTLGEIFKDEDHTGDWGYRAYLIRALFSLREDTGAYLAMNGELTVGKDTIFSHIFWEGVEKSIHIVCRDWIPTKGHYETWFDEHKSEVNDKFTELKKSNPSLSDDKLQIEAENKVLAYYVGRTKNEWKAIAWLGAMEYRSSESIDAAIRVAEQVGYLDGSILRMTPKGKSAKNKKEVEKFIEAAKNSTN